MLFAFYIFRKATSESGPAVRFYVPKPADSAVKDDVTALWRIENVPYGIDDGMVVTLNDRSIPDPAIYADVAQVERHIFADNEGATTATLKLQDPNDFERLSDNPEWYIVRKNAEPSPSKPSPPLSVALAAKALS
jgi:hypothetical protein